MEIVYERKLRRDEVIAVGEYRRGNVAWRRYKSLKYLERHLEEYGKLGHAISVRTVISDALSRRVFWGVYSQTKGTWLRIRIQRPKRKKT